MIHRAVALLISGTALLLANCSAAPPTSTTAHTANGVPPLGKHYQAACAALGSGDEERAKMELRLSLQDNPLHVESHFLLASLLGREGDMEQAIVGFQRTITLEPNNAVARYNVGTTLLWRGEPVQAARLLEESIVIAPDHVASYNNLAKAYFLAGVPELAVASYQEALRRDPTNPIARENLAILTAAVADPSPRAATNAEKPAADTQKPKGPVNPAPPAPPPAGDQKTPALAEMPPISDAEGETRNRASVESLRELLRELPHVTAEQRGGRIVLSGWTRGPAERAQLDQIIASRPDVLDITSGDAGDPNRLLEIDAIIFLVIGRDSESIGHDFLRNVQVTAQYFDSEPSPAFDWLFSASVDYQVNIANAAEQRVAFLARPHLTTVSGSPAMFLAGGDIVFRVSGTTSGDIVPYPFGTTLEVTPTLLRTPGEDGRPLVRLAIRAGRKSVLPLESLEARSSGDSTAFTNVEVTSEAVLGLGQTLILTGLSQRESTKSSSGVPILKDIPGVKYLFSSETTTISDASVIILLTPRDPAYWDAQNKKALAEFVEKRRAYVRAAQGTEEDMRRFKERYPDWDQIAPNRFASHFFLMDNSAVYRAVSGVDLAHESLDFELLDSLPKQTGTP